MKVIGAGLGRTGTTSLKVALEQLGFAPCYHMTELLKHPEHAPTWEAATAGQPVDWAAFLGSYGASVDWPGCTFYKELMVAFPDAKVLLSVRDPDRWYDSCLSTIYAIANTWPTTWFGRYLPKFGSIMRVGTPLIWEQTFEGRFLDRAFAIGRFHAHTEDVVRHVPPERLLVFDVKEGWEPLCKFLGVPVPSTPFPHLNDTAEFQARTRLIRAAQIAVLGLVAGGLIWLGSRLLRRR